MERNNNMLTDEILDGRYKIIKDVGIGGMAVVYGAYDLKEHKTVAVKVLKKENDGVKNGTDSRENAEKRFITEAATMQSLSHRNIVRVFDSAIKEEDEIKYFVMEYIEANTLKTMISNYGALEPRDILLLAEQILLALKHTHSRGVLHCDIKPQNIMLLGNGGIKLTDFGIARFIDSEENKESDIAVGTVYYISPEQASGKPLDARSDLYSLGVMMYEMATGQLPFNHDDPSKVAKMQIEQAPRRPRSINPAIPKGLEQIILHAMEKHAFMRYPDASHMLAAVRTLLDNEDIIFDYGNELPEPSRRNAVSEPDKGISGKVFALFGAASAFLIALAVTAVISISLSASAGKSAVVMPDLVGKRWLGAAAAELGGECCEVRVEYVVNAELEQNTVISQSVPAGTKAAGSRNDPFEVTVKVSRKNEYLTMGDYTFFTEERAVRELEGLGYSVSVERVSDRSVEKGRVISTLPAAGSTTVINDRIIITVSE